jgi:3-hydroxyacyl-[acyl-carrier-protein] dehydratase
MPPKVLFDVTHLDQTKIAIDKETIRAINPHRYEFEMLDGILHLEQAQHLLVGYKDVLPSEFWVRGHIPGFPLMPGVLICEVAAQLSSFYVRWGKLIDADFLGFGGMNDISFRKPVVPGDRLLMVAVLSKCNRRQITSQCQGFVNGTMVFAGEVIGVPISLPK